MRILHISSHGRFGYFQEHTEFICEQLGHTCETQQIADKALTADKANEWWKNYSAYYDSFDAVFVSHIANPSRIFLQNDWKKPLYIWLEFRFDYFHPPEEVSAADRDAYYKLIQQAQFKSNVKIFAASESDKAYAQRRLGEFPIDVVPFLVYATNDTKIKIPCGKDTFFVVSKHNETVFMDLKKRLDELGIPAYKHEWSLGQPDLRGVKGIIHIPYHHTPRSLYENLALENVYFLPSVSFWRALHECENFFWDVPDAPYEEIKLAEWYSDEYKDLFVYFSSFEHLKEISNDRFLPDLIAAKKRYIREFNQQHNSETIEKWRRIFYESNQ